MITTRDIKVFIFSILFSTLCYALFNQPIKEAEAQGGGGLLAIHAEKAREIHNDTYDLLQAHIKGAIANHNQTRDLIQDHINGAVAKHAEMLEKLDALLAHLGAK